MSAVKKSSRAPRSERRSTRSKTPQALQEVIIHRKESKVKEAARRFTFRVTFVKLYTAGCYNRNKGGQRSLIIQSGSLKLFCYLSYQRRMKRRRGGFSFKQEMFCRRPKKCPFPWNRLVASLNLLPLVVLIFSSCRIELKPKSGETAMFSVGVFLLKFTEFFAFFSLTRIFHRLASREKTRKTADKERERDQHSETRLTQSVIKSIGSTRQFPQPAFR